VFTPAVNTGITLAEKGTAMLQTTFTPTSDVVNFFTVSAQSAPVIAVNAFELSAVPVPEPATGGLMLLAIGGFSAMHLRRWRARS
jgi:hypothetical protein